MTHDVPQLVTLSVFGMRMVQEICFNIQILNYFEK